MHSERVCAPPSLPCCRALAGAGTAPEQVCTRAQGAPCLRTYLALAAGSQPEVVCTAVSLQELARRLSKSAPMRKVQDLQAAIAQHEKQLTGLTGDAKEVRTAAMLCNTVTYDAEALCWVGVREPSQPDWER